MFRWFVIPIVLATVPYPSYSQLTSLAGVNSWAYQLQNISPSQIAADTSFELVVIDYSSDGTDAGKFSAADLASIKNSGKYAISYLSIGEAENYRYYWQLSWDTNPPAWMGPVNPDWPGNYKVRFWDPQWQALVFDYVDTIMSQGFDGIYLDIVDAWYYWTDENPEEPMADSLMIDFINKLRVHVDSASSGQGFIIMPQNGEDVLDGNNIDTPMRNLLFSSVNAIGVEDVFYPGNLDEDNLYNPDMYRDSLLMEFISNGKRVFSVEYLTDPTKIQLFVSVATGKSYVPYYCLRNLDQLCQNLTIGLSDASVLPNERILSLKVFDLSGREVYHSDGGNSDVGKFHNLRYNALFPGIYILQAITKSATYSQKILVAY